MQTLTTRQIGATGLRVSTLGFGGAPIGGLLRPAEQGAAAAALRRGLDAGIGYVDTAPYYGFGKSERIVGDVLRGRTCVLSTKVGRLLRPGAHPQPLSLGWSEPLPFHPVFDYSHDAILRSVDDSLQRLGLDRIDMLLVHDIGEMTHGREANARHFAELQGGGYRALEMLRATGAVKAIGLGVNEAEVCLDAMEVGDWDVFLLAGRYTLLEQAPLDNLMPACAAAKISVIIGGPFNSGVLAGGGTWNYAAVPFDVQTRTAALQQAAAEHGVPLPAAALQFPLAHPAVASVIPGVRDPGQLAGVLDWIRIRIPAEFWADLKQRNLLHSESPVPAGSPFYADC
ncbi:MAG: aldo/keto reductase [Gammaproteobacteria bacterium]|nr:aldo/keto reductase [Gammaproteobacteria bacterium]MDD9870994.1 aldo/keto reductase [Gammaproteobacteria bacterium]